jgi:deleted-in-malignant-brain-tumors protein 1
MGAICTGAVAITSGFTNGAGRILLSDVQCRGTETTLTGCAQHGYGVHACSHDQDAGVRCTPCSPQGAIRLQGGNGTSGRVEICNNNIWVRVCGNSLDTNATQVACRQLGFEHLGRSVLYMTM